MRILLIALMIIGGSVGLEATHHCVCKPKITKEMKKEKKAKHKAARKRADEAFKTMHTKRKNHCYCAGVFQTIPVDRILVQDAKVKRDSNGDRI